MQIMRKESHFVISVVQHTHRGNTYKINKICLQLLTIIWLNKSGYT
jgi:hypothetical protein